MAIPKMDEDVEIISKLGDIPGSQDGLSPQGLKERFDLAGVRIKNFINNKLIPAIESSVDEDGLLSKIGQELGKKLSLSGGTMTGNLNMNSKKITNLGTPTADGHAVNKQYADAIKATAEEAKSTAEAAIPSSQKGKASGVASLNDNSKVIPSQTRSTIAVINGTSHKIVPDNEGRMLRVYNDGADCVITLPGGSDTDLDVGAEIEILSYTKGGVTIKAPSDRYLLYAGCPQNTMGGSLKIGHTYGCVALKKVASVSWIASGDIE